MRILPHAQDTGGFFVAVLHKKAPCPWESKKAYENGESNGANGQEAGKGIDLLFFLFIFKLHYLLPKFLHSRSLQFNELQCMPRKSLTNCSQC